MLKILDNLKFCVVKVKCPVSIQRPFLNFSGKCPSNVMYDLKHLLLKFLTRKTYNSDFRLLTYMDSNLIEY